MADKILNVTAEYTGSEQITVPDGGRFDTTWPGTEDEDDSEDPTTIKVPFGGEWRGIDKDNSVMVFGLPHD